MSAEPKRASVSYHAVQDDVLRSPPPALSKSSRRCNILNSMWFWELLAAVASFGCIIAIAVILARMNGKALDRWTFSISLNATIAIFITAGKSLALLVIAACIAQAKWIHFKSSPRRLQELDFFESAARGPLGSLMLLFHVRWTLGIAGAGAIATILALGVDTFAQQVVKLDTRNVEAVKGDGTFGLSHGYNATAKWLVPEPYDIDGTSPDSLG